ncbi:MAG TPA: glucose-6-phosphate isomerase, partial [Bacteroidetes bacterium]|nr:glucose-6-phosphate isomerase [Bacteroidota bacterium]
MNKLTFQYDMVLDFVTKDEIHQYQTETDEHFAAIYNKTGKGNNFLGWVDLPDNTDETLISRIEATAKKMREQSEIFVIIGIGGSYLG